MKTLYLLAFVLAGCASMPRAELADQAVFESYPVEQVREATRIVLEDVTPSRSQTGVWDADDQVLTEGRIGVCERDVACGGSTLYVGQNAGTPWTTIKVRLLDRGKDTAVKVAIEYQTTSHCGDGYHAVSCVPEQLSSTGFLEDRIIQRIRARLEARGVVADRLPR